MHSDVLELRGHIIDSLVLPQIMEEVMDRGGEFVIQQIDVGRRKDEPSYARIQISADEVIVKGFPWGMTLCIRGRDHLRSDSGELVYENRYVIWGHLRWFKLKRYEVYEDTQKTVVFDRWLVDNQHAAAVA